MPNYPGSGKATIIDVNSQKLFWDNERVGAAQASVAFQLSRIHHGFYPWGAAIEIQFSGAPGTFQVDIQGSETDKNECYIKLATTSIINAVNGSNVGRYDLVNLFPKFIRLYTTTFPNDLHVLATLTR